MTTTTTRTQKDLAKLSNAELEKLLREGTTPKWEDLVGFTFRGWNVATMAYVLRIKKFAKFFFEKDGKHMGGNCPVRQSAIEEPWSLKPSDEAPKKFGFYEVRATAAGERDHRYPNAVLLDYSRGGNPLLDVTKTLRDFVVQPDRDNKDLFLGKAYVALGPLRVFGGFFIIERLRRS